MSALLVDDLIVQVPTRTQPGRCRHGERVPPARPQLTVLPGGRPDGVAAPTVRPQARAVCPAAPGASEPGTSGWQLTERGIAVVVVFFLALVATAAVVLVTSFLSVSNAPLHEVPPPAGAVIHG